MQLAWDLRSSMLHASLGVYVVVVYVIAEQSFIIVHVVIVVIFIIVGELFVRALRYGVLSLIEGS